MCNLTGTFTAAQNLEYRGPIYQTLSLIFAQQQKYLKATSYGEVKGRDCEEGTGFGLPGYR
jgi:hypothetical protein